MRVAITCLQLQRDFAEWATTLRVSDMDVVLPDVDGQQLAGAALIEALADVDGVIAGDDQFTREVLQNLPRLRVISKWGIGIDGIDLAAAEELGVVVTNTPGVFAEEVADVALGYLILLARGLHAIDAAVRQGDWPKPVGRSLNGCSVAIIGFGSIGRAFARRALACGMTVYATDPAASPTTGDDRVHLVDLPTALGAADYIVLTCSLNESTRHLLNASTLEVVRPGASVINVARGAIIDEAALVASIRDGRIASAALDVMEVEPLPPQSELRALNVILGSHNASNTAEACVRTHELAISNLLRALQNRG